MCVRECVVIAPSPTQGAHKSGDHDAIELMSLHLGTLGLYPCELHRLGACPNSHAATGKTLQEGVIERLTQYLAEDGGSTVADFGVWFDDVVPRNGGGAVQNRGNCAATITVWACSREVNEEAAC